MYDTVSNFRSISLDIHVYSPFWELYVLKFSLNFLYEKFPKFDTETDHIISVLFFDYCSHSTSLQESEIKKFVRILFPREKQSLIIERELFI